MGRGGEGWSGWEGQGVGLWSKASLRQVKEKRKRRHKQNFWEIMSSTFLQFSYEAVELALIVCVDVCACVCVHVCVCVCACV